MSLQESGYRGHVCPRQHPHADSPDLVRLSLSVLLTLFIAAGSGPVHAQVPLSAYTNFEGAQTNPVRLSADSKWLYAVNTPDARLSIFSLGQPSAPVLLKEIPVGIEPVSVTPRTPDEVWVVNQVSDSISVVSISKGIVIDTIYVKDEPADVVFVGQNLAFVSVSRSNKVCVFDAVTRQLVATIPLQGGNPRALAVSPNGQTVYALFALSGNRTTVIPGPFAPPPPPPTNPALPPGPQVGLIVDALDPRFQYYINFTLPDNDVAVIDTATLSVSGYIPRVGTVNLGIAVRPGTGDLYISNTNARNLVRFEPNVRGHIVDNRITRVTLSGQLTAFDLNPGIDYATLPNPAALASALAQPAGLVFDPGGQFLYVAAFGTDRVAKVDTNGHVLTFVNMGPPGTANDPRHKRGPRGLALNAAAQRLYVLNRISNTISVIDTSVNGVLKEIPTGNFDPTPQVIRDGRGFLYDAKLSGNGTAACAACHIDADMDKLAWDLGDPGGDMQTVIAKDGTSFDLHPMKGPMTTQTLRGLLDLSPYHWRGDRADLTAFNPAFDSLMGGTQLSDVDMAAYADFINTIHFQPNPNQNLDRTLPVSFNGGNPQQGQFLFLNLNVGLNTCNGCHTSNPGPGTSRNIIAATATIAGQPLKVPQLRNVYQKLDFATLIDGFGLTNDGAVPELQLLLSKAFPIIADKPAALANLSAFVMCFDTGTAPAVGYTRTLTTANVADPAALADWDLLQNQASAANIDLIVKGTLSGQVRGLVFRPAQNSYQSDRRSVAPFTRADLTTLISQGDTLTLMGVPRGSGLRMGIDRNLDGILDGDQ